MGLISLRNLRTFARRNRNVIAKAKATRYVVHHSKSFNFCTSQTSKQSEEGTVKEILAALKQSNWQYLMESSGMPKKLNPEVVRSVLYQNQVNDPKRLLHFFDWSASVMGVPQNLNSFSILAIALCNSSLFALANGVLERMMGTRKPPLEIIDSIVRCYTECGGSNLVVFEILVNAYKKMGLLNEAASVFLEAKNGGFFPSLVCCNSLLKDLVKCNRMELFWKVYDGMLESKISPDVYTYTTVINAHSKVGNVEEVRRVLFEMEEKGCSPNLVTFNVVIGGLCRSGAVDEALELKKSMAGKGLLPDAYTYSILVDGFMKQGKQKRC
jgi:leucine-rich PPR motif-containing protein